MKIKLKIKFNYVGFNDKYIKNRLKIKKLNIIEKVSIYANMNISMTCSISMTNIKHFT